MKNKVQYLGAFINKYEILEAACRYGKQLSGIIENPHMTILFAPNKKALNGFKKYIGKKIKLTLYQYANDGKNEGFRVRPVEGGLASEVMKYADDDIIPHITVSVDGTVDKRTGEKKGKAVNTRHLFDGSFDDKVINIEPFEIEAVLGGYVITEEKTKEKEYKVISKEQFIGIIS